LWMVDFKKISNGEGANGITAEEAARWNIAVYGSDQTNAGAITQLKIPSMVFRDPAFQEFPPYVSLQNYFDATKGHRKIDIGEPGSETFETLRNVQLLLMGKEVPNASDLAVQIARERTGTRRPSQLYESGNHGTQHVSCRH